LGGDMMFFVALISVFFVTRASGHWDAYSHYVNEWLPTAIPSILWLNTAVLLISSVTAEIARQAMFREQDAMDEWFGFGALIAALMVLQRSRSLSTRQVLVDSTVWYWHVMGALWIFLFLLLEYGQ
jgi:heme/copper-type cytochrome/quinol oxidase subunit 3